MLAIAPAPRSLAAEEVRAFILANTKLLNPPLVPEIRLHLAEESLPIWRKTEEELGALNLPPPYWAFAWAGGQALARHLLDHPRLVAGKGVLDIGSGSGLVGIAAARAGAAHTMAFDIDPLACAAAGLNAAANGIAIGISSENLFQPPHSRYAEVLLLGDLFYERELAAEVLRYLEPARAQGASIVAGDPERSYFPAHRFKKLAEYSVPVTRELEDCELKRTSVWLFDG